MFTLQEYIDKHKLEVSVLDPHATRILTGHLKERGYVKVRRKGVWYWVPATDAPNYDVLKAKLEKIK